VALNLLAQRPIGYNFLGMRPLCAWHCAKRRNTLKWQRKEQHRSKELENTYMGNDVPAASGKKIRLTSLSKCAG
jgi:hypothetical protein